MDPIRRRLPCCAAALALLLAAPLAAADPAKGPIIPLSDDEKQDLALFGEGVIGKPVPAPPIDDVRALVNLHPGTWVYAIVAGKKKGTTRNEVYSKNADGTWTRNLGNDMIVYMNMTDDAWTRFAETDLSFDYRSDFEPPIHHAARWKPGDSKVIESDIKVTKVGEPDDVKYTGKMKSTISYKGAYEVTTPAGKFNASLLKGVFDIKVGPADVVDTQYAFFAPGVGKVAEIEGLSVSALFIYHSHDKTATVLTKPPKGSK
jgi:hypothetical protein